MHLLIPKWRHFEEVGISQQGKGLLPPSFIIFLLSSRPLSWWCYLKDSISGLGYELIIRLFFFILGYEKLWLPDFFCTFKTTLQQALAEKTN